MFLKLGTFATAIILLFMTLIHVTESQDTSVTSAPESCSLCTYYYPDGMSDPLNEHDRAPLSNHACRRWTTQCCVWANDWNSCAIVEDGNLIYPCGGCPPTSAPSRAPSKGPIPFTCGYSTFKYRNTSGSSACFECDVGDIGYECQGGSTLNVEYG
eukprot:1063823_1